MSVAADFLRTGLNLHSPRFIRLFLGSQKLTCFPQPVTSCVPLPVHYTVLSTSS